MPSHRARQMRSTKYVLGLTATPVRRDGQQPIIFMQCGPIRHTAAKPEGAPQTLEVTPRFLSTAIVVHSDAGIQEVFRTLAVDDARTARIVGEIVDAYLQGRKVLVLTERTEHLAAIGAALSGDSLSMLRELEVPGSRASRCFIGVCSCHVFRPPMHKYFIST